MKPCLPAAKKQVELASRLSGGGYHDRDFIFAIQVFMNNIIPAAIIQNTYAKEANAVRCLVLQSLRGSDRRTSVLQPSEGVSDCGLRVPSTKVSRICVMPGLYLVLNLPSFRVTHAVMYGSLHRRPSAVFRTTDSVKRPGFKSCVCPSLTWYLRRIS